MTPYLTIESLDLEGRGIARRDGKVIFVEGGLPAEQVEVESLKIKSSYEIARAVKIRTPSSQRTPPLCEHFGICGGCAMQHVTPIAQVAMKQRALEDALWHIAKLRPDILLSAVQGSTWNYRHRARWAVRYLNQRAEVLVGFREKHSSYVADIRSCKILPASISALLLPLRALVQSLSRPDRIPQIEVAVGKDTTALVLRHLLPLTQGDRSKLQIFAKNHAVQWWLQGPGDESLQLLEPQQISRLHYTLPDFQLEFNFLPQDFTQVNPAINQILVSLAIRHLELLPTDHVVDLFCGLGNFTLALARTDAKQVVGVEGSASLIKRATQAAKKADLAKKCRFISKNLFEVNTPWWQNLWHQTQAIDKLLLDPPREGALAVARTLGSNENEKFRPRRLVYVSCNPATLARDAGILVHQAGYRLRSAGVVNMFPHTAHVESIAIFDRT